MWSRREDKPSMSIIKSGANLVDGRKNHLKEPDFPKEARKLWGQDTKHQSTCGKQRVSGKHQTTSPKLEKCHVSTKGRWNTPSNGHNTTQIDDYFHNGTMIDPAIKPMRQRPHLDVITTQKSFAMVSSIVCVQSCKK